MNAESLLHYVAKMRRGAEEGAEEEAITGPVAAYVTITRLISTRWAPWVGPSLGRA